MQLQGLKRKSPNSRHYFGYRLNGELHSGLKSDYIKELNTVIRPDIDVSEDVKCINAGLAKNPVNEDISRDISRDISAKIKKIRRNILVNLAISCVLFLLLDVNFVIKIVITVIIWILAMRKWLSSLASIKYENNETQWEVNERVYGEHLNENGEYVLYPKRGDGFYCLSPLEYLNLYTLQIHKGNLEKSEILFQNLRNTLILKRVISRKDILSDKEKENIWLVYNECNEALTKI